MSSTGLGATPNRMVSATSGAKISASRQPMSLMPASAGFEHAEDHLAVEPQRIAGRQDDAERGEESPPRY